MASLNNPESNETITPLVRPQNRNTHMLQTRCIAKHPKPNQPLNTYISKVRSQMVHSDNNKTIIHINNSQFRLQTHSVDKIVSTNIFTPYAW